MMKRELKDVRKTDSACLNCIYFEQFDEQKKKDNLLGACKANPPVPGDSSKGSGLGMWPLVLATFWCGVFNSMGEK